MFGAQSLRRGLHLQETSADLGRTVLRSRNSLPDPGLLPPSSAASRVEDR